MAYTLAIQRCKLDKPRATVGMNITVRVKYKSFI